MKVKYECIECLAKQTVKLANKLSNDETVKQEIISYGLKALGENAFKVTPPYITALICEHAADLTGEGDPYRDEKIKSNRMAEKIIEDFDIKKRLLESPDAFDTATRLSIAGNVIDFSLGYDIDEDLISESVEASLKAGLYGHTSSQLKEAISQSKKILFLADNAGEIVFDQLMVSLMPKSKVTYAVKGGPIVNDATMFDAVSTGMDKLVPVVDTGSHIQGTLLDHCSDEFKEIFDQADLVISKGQANYETLNHLSDKNIYFLLKAKCQCIADEIGCQKDDFVIVKP